MSQILTKTPMTKHRFKDKYLLEVQELKSFLYSQLELYKIEFADTGNNKYLDVMNKLNKCQETVFKMDELIQELLKRRRNLLQELEKNKRINQE